MKKRRIYTIAVVVLLIAVAGIVYSYTVRQKEKANKEYVLLPRKGAAENTAEWKDVQSRANTLITALKADPEDSKSSLKLAALFIQEARETGNYIYYDVAAMKHINKVLETEPENFNALVFKSLIYLSQHHFAEGLATAEQARVINPSNAYVYGLLIDGNVEMGNYDSAIVNADRMIAIRPDLTSYSRISYIREIFGDYSGAINAMKLAVEAGGRGDEHTEWTRTQLAALYEKTGNYTAADSLYNMSLSMRPTYPYALAGLARIATANKDYNKAIAYYKQADSLVADNNMKEELIEAYKMAGQPDNAQQTALELIADLEKNSKAINEDDNIGHYSDRELAYAYLQVNDPAKALDHALLEYKRRPENIDVNETLAWTYYNTGETAKALEHIKKALRTNSKNPVLLCRAALIYFKAGDKQMAKKMLVSTEITNPYITHSLQAEAATMAQSL